MKKILFLFIPINLVSREIILMLGGIGLNRKNAIYMNKIKSALLKEGREVIDDINVEIFDDTI